jgi:GntR family transcriptional regulator
VATKAQAAAEAPERRSLVDVAEQALRDWLVPGRHRPGDRLPPEHDLAAMLGVSRGTLRMALERLQDAGEIVRRQGSGTFVGRVAELPAFSEGLEVLESYASLAARRRVALGVRDLTIEERPLEEEFAAGLGLDAGTPTTTVLRTLLADGVPAARMRDIVHPDVPLPAREELRAALESGLMVLDVLVEARVPIAFARTAVRARLALPDDPNGRGLEVRGPTAVIELRETMHVTTGEALQHSTDVFLSRGIDLHVMRAFKRAQPEQVAPR